MQLLRIIKINIFALLAFPFLVLATCAKLLQQTLSKILVFVGVAAMLGALFILSYIIKSPESMFSSIGGMVVAVGIFWVGLGVILAILYLFGNGIAFISTFVVRALYSWLNFIYMKCHRLYAKLYDSCTADYILVGQRINSKGWLLILLPIWQIIRMLNWIAVKIFVTALPLSILTSLLLVLGGGGYMYYNISSTFGIGLFEYLAIFPVIEAVFAGVYVAVIYMAVIIVLLALGAEWGRWGRVLALATKTPYQFKDASYTQAAEIFQFNITDYKLDKADECDKCQMKYEILSFMFSDILNVYMQVDMAIFIRHNTNVVCDFSEYMSILARIKKILTKHGTDIKCSVFEIECIHLIDRANTLVSHVLKDSVAIIGKDAKENGVDIDFFEGCSNSEELEQRYNSLCRIYNVDVGAQDEISTELNRQYSQYSK